jgi:hypothetical protein
VPLISPSMTPSRPPTALTWGFNLDPPLAAADAASETADGMGSDITRHLVPLNAARAAQGALGERAGGEPAAQVALLRDVFGNLLRRPPPLPAAILAWSDGTARRIAEGIYEDRQMPEGTLDTGRLAILADALLDAGCHDEVLIQHCRSEGPHVRGCWAVDLVLGKL